MLLGYDSVSCSCGFSPDGCGHWSHEVTVVVESAILDVFDIPDGQQNFCIKCLDLPL